MDFIMSDYAKQGYATLVAEDFTPLSIPSYVRITKNPIAYYDRPFR